LYHSITSGSNPLICELLLKEHSQLGVTDFHGSEEIHQACKAGYVQHVEHLVFYGANVNARTASGNTPLHICALENQESCARVLLFRGADRVITNYAQQTPYDVAILSNNLDVALLLNDFDERNVTPFKHKPDYVQRKRLATLTDGRPQSLSLSPSLSIDSSTLDTTSEASSDQSTSPVSLEKGFRAISTPANMHTLGLVRHQRKASTGSLPETVEEHSETESDSEDEDRIKPMKPIRAFSNGGVGTRRSPAPIKRAPENQHHGRSRLYASVPGRSFVVIKDYEPVLTGEVALKKGDTLDVLYVGEGGFWEGSVRGRVGWFPSACVQEVKKGDSMRGKLPWLGGKKKSPVADIFAEGDIPKPKTINLKKGDKGFGFQMRGANSHMPHIDFQPTPQFPALQYIGEVDKGGVAEKAGLHPGDFVLEINHENVVNATHGYAVSLISKGGKALSIKVVTVAPETGESTGYATVPNGSLNGTLPKSNKTPPPPPPVRATSTALSNFSNLDDSVLTEGSVAPIGVETMVLDTNKSRTQGAKGMWSGSAFRLQGDDSSVKEDNIGSGIARKSATMTNEIAARFDERLRSMTQQITVDKTDDRQQHPRRNSSLSSNSSNSSTDPNEQKPKRKATPPGYDHTMDNMRRGRTNSLGRGDNVRPPVIIKRSQTEEHSPDARRMNGHMQGVPNLNNRHTMYDEYAFDQRQQQRQHILPDKNQFEIPQQYATTRRYNRNDPATAYNHPMVQYRDPRVREEQRMRGRPLSEILPRDYMDRQQMRPYPGYEQHHYNTLQPHHMHNNTHNQQRRQETVLEKHQRKYLENDFYNRPMNDPRMQHQQQMHDPRLQQQQPQQQQQQQQHQIIDPRLQPPMMDRLASSTTN